MKEETRVYSAKEVAEIIYQLTGMSPCEWGVNPSLDDAWCKEHCAKKGNTDIHCWEQYLREKESGEKKCQ